MVAGLLVVGETGKDFKKKFGSLGLEEKDLRELVFSNL